MELFTIENIIAALTFLGFIGAMIYKISKVETETRKEIEFLNQKLNNNDKRFDKIDVNIEKISNDINQTSISIAEIKTILKERDN